jgi:hypothetical protein
VSSLIFLLTAHTAEAKAHPSASRCVCYTPYAAAQWGSRLCRRRAKMRKFVSILLCFVALVLLRSPIRALEEKFRIDDLEIQLGESEGLSVSSTISAEGLQRILNGVENGNKENIYFYALLKLYGISLSKDLSTAALNFNRASSLGHMEATTAYGVMLMSGHGVKKDPVSAMKYFRRGVEMGDMVRELLSTRSVTTPCVCVCFCVCFCVCVCVCACPFSCSYPCSCLCSCLYSALCLTNASPSFSASKCRIPTGCLASK